MTTFPAPISLSTLAERVPTLTGSDDTSQRGIAAGAKLLAASVHPDRLLVIPKTATSDMCVNCVVDPDPVTGVDVRTCETCLCFICHRQHCFADTVSNAQSISGLGADALGTLAGCLQCAFKGALRGLKGKTAEMKAKESQLISSTVGGRLHFGCAISRYHKGSQPIVCPSCRDPLLQGAGTTTEANVIKSEVPSEPISTPTVTFHSEPAGRKCSVDLFSSIVGIDPRVACFNDIHAGVREWANGAEVERAGIELRRRPRTMELYLHVADPLRLPPLHSSQMEATERKRARLIDDLFGLRASKGRRKDEAHADRRKLRVVEASAEGMLLSEVFGLAATEAEDYRTILGPAIVECLADDKDLKKIRQNRLDKGEGSKKQTTVKIPSRVSTGTLGESAFVLARAQRLLEMSRRWDEVGSGAFEENL